ncbi:hypothetical protein PBY51_002252 [Eleginops maclovinus]|uniref:Enteropeptidase n=1 Tax=Eleginops maclovinus TaxID=56733 RepID=A0AAN7XCE1_ELEMC|nr:hypothetical protein PBY51_002252 [Eleginops maclovinus]
MRMKRLSSLEFLLSVVSALLLLCCLALIVFCWISLKPGGAVEPAVQSGRMLITEGVFYSEELKNSSSQRFKSLAYDVQHLVSEAFGHSQLKQHFLSCKVSSFSQGSVAVTFDLWFNQLIDLKEVEQQLGAGLQEAGGTGLVIDRNSIQITEQQDVTTAAPTGETSVSATAGETSVSPTAETCPPLQTSCADPSLCIPIGRLCDGQQDCPDGSDEYKALCATACDGQFVLIGPSGWFSSDVSETHNSSKFCRWIIRLDRGLSVQIHFLRFHTEENKDRLKLYEGVGADRQLRAELSGSAPPGTVWLFSDQSMMEFICDDVNNLSGFNATFSAVDTSLLSNQQKLTCSFEQGMCFWRQQDDEDDGDWYRTSGSTFPPLSGPSADHTLGNSSGFYIVTPRSPGQWLKSFRIHSLPLTPHTEPMCLSFWYHMFGEDVHRLRVLLEDLGVTVVFQRDGNYGDNWNYGQVMLHLTKETKVVFEALKEGGMENDIALDDIKLTSDPCGPSPPEPTNVPPPTTKTPIPADCGGPFDLWEPNSTFSSPNFPQSYGNKAQCRWTLHSAAGRNLALHFLDFDVEAGYDVVEVRDGAGLNSTLLAVLSGSSGPARTLFSTANQMTVWFYTDESGHGRGFRANFSSGFDLGSPAGCAEGQFQCRTGSCIHGNGQCDGQAECPDASDESHCVMNTSSRLQFQRVSSRLTVCSDTWSPHLSVFTCQYLGYRSGGAQLLPARVEDSPFTWISESNGTLTLRETNTCSREEVVSLNCDNQPCGVRQMTNNTRETYQSGERTPDPGEVRVVGGVSAVKGAWPWIVSLHWAGRHLCGASVIGPDWLLTAAHCVYGKNVQLNAWSAVFGLHSQSDSSTAQTRRVDRIVINRKYDRRSKEADIAMMHLQEPISFSRWIQPLCLPSEGQDVPIGSCFLAGWGRDAEQGSLPDVLQEALVPLVPPPQCEQQLPEYTITSSMLCAGYPEGGGGLLPGRLWGSSDVSAGRTMDSDWCDVVRGWLWTPSEARCVR